MFEPVCDADIPTVVALLNRAYRGTGADASWNSEAGAIAGDRTTEALLRADLHANPDAVLLGWRERPGETLCGCVWLQPIGGGTWYLGSLAADPMRQNSGLGRRMLVAAERRVGEGGGTRVRMTVVNVRETLIAWYCRRGYQPTGTMEPFPYDDNRFGTPLRDDLAFVVLEKELGAVRPDA